MAAGGTLVRTQSFDVDSSTPKWLQFARKDMGITEWVRTRRNPNPVVQKWVQEAMGDPNLVEDVTSDNYPWCAMYVGAKLVECGYPSTRSGMARSYLNYGTPVDKGDDSQWKQGDIVVFWRGKANDGVTGHVAFLLAWDRSNVYVVGGNQGDEVSIMREPRSKILGVRRPRSFFQSKTALSSAGSAGAGVAKATVGAIAVGGAASAATPPGVDTLTSGIATTPQMPSPEQLQQAYDQAHPYLAMFAKYKPEIELVLTVASISLAAYAAYWRYKDWSKGRT